MKAKQRTMSKVIFEVERNATIRSLPMLQSKGRRAAVSQEFCELARGWDPVAVYLYLVQPGSYSA